MRNMQMLFVSRMFIEKIFSNFSFIYKFSLLGMYKITDLSDVQVNIFKVSPNRYHFTYN